MTKRVDTSPAYVHLNVSSLDTEVQDLATARRSVFSSNLDNVSHARSSFKSRASALARMAGPVVTRPESRVGTALFPSMINLRIVIKDPRLWVQENMEKPFTLGR